MQKQRTNIKNQSLIYQITDLANLESILEEGIKSRSQLNPRRFSDVADRQILEGREAHNLHKMVPFHFFARNPFDGSVQESNSDIEFVILTVRRSLAALENWKIIPRHPLAIGKFQILDYADGMDAIDWELMSKREYHDPECKSVCMAECLSPTTVPSSNIFSIFTRNGKVAEEVGMLCNRHNLTPHINVQTAFFING